MWLGVITLFPEMFRAITEQGVTGRAVKNGLIQLQCWNPRDFTHDKHRTVDDRPYGGGPGMLMMVQPLTDAINAAQAAAEQQTSGKAKVIYLSLSNGVKSKSPHYPAETPAVIGFEWGVFLPPTGARGFHPGPLGPPV